MEIKNIVNVMMYRLNKVNRLIKEHNNNHNSHDYEFWYNWLENTGNEKIAFIINYDMNSIRATQSNCLEYELYMLSTIYEHKGVADEMKDMDICLDRIANFIEQVYKILS
jgi:hypothetical protein